MKVNIDLIYRTESGEEICELEKHGVVYPVGTSVDYKGKVYKVSSVVLLTNCDTNKVDVTITDTGKQADDGYTRVSLRYPPDKS